MRQNLIFKIFTFFGSFLIFVSFFFFVNNFSKFQNSEEIEFKSANEFLDNGNFIKGSVYGPVDITENKNISKVEVFENGEFIKVLEDSSQNVGEGFKPSISENENIKEIKIGDNLQSIEKDFIKNNSEINSKFTKIEDFNTSENGDNLQNEEINGIKLFTDSEINAKLQKSENYENNIRIFYNFEPKNYINEANTYRTIIENILGNYTFLQFVNNSSIYISFQENGELERGKMANKGIYFYSPHNYSLEEIVSVFIHEFGHYFDIYTFEEKNNLDLSKFFYNISWEDTKTLKENQTMLDFVSGYAMTNKYEDFSESFVYYILHNEDFLEKSKDSEILYKKYKFIENFVFRKKEFQNTDFSDGKDIKFYFWDVTKKDFDLNKFLNYLGSL